MSTTVECQTCGGPVPPAPHKDEQGRYLRADCCSRACTDAFTARVEQLARARHPELWRQGSLVLDPAVGDEREIARSSLRRRIADELSRATRLRAAARECERLGLDPALASDLVLLAERQAGSNTVDVEIARQYYRVFVSGAIRSLAATDLYGYWWLLDGDAWQEVRNDDYYPTRLPRPVAASGFGDLAGATAISVVEHGERALDLEDEPVPDPGERRARADASAEALGRWRAAVTEANTVARALIAATLADSGFRSAGYSWHLPEIGYQKDWEIVAQVHDPHRGEQLWRARTADGETVYVRTFGNAVVLYAPPATVERAWLEQRERLGTTPPEAREWLRRARGCAGTEYYEYVAAQER